MTDPKSRRFTAEEMETWARLSAARSELAEILRQAASDLRERERIMAALKCTIDYDGDHIAAHGIYRVDCPACAIRRAAGLEES